VGLEVGAHPRLRRVAGPRDGVPFLARRSLARDARVGASKISNNAARFSFHRSLSNTPKNAKRLQPASRPISATARGDRRRVVRRVAPPFPVVRPIPREQRRAARSPPGPGSVRAGYPRIGAGCHPVRIRCREARQSTGRSRSHPSWARRSAGCLGTILARPGNRTA
jgi:hypothetical protein